MANESEATCVRCDKPLAGLQRESMRKFCSKVCRTRYFALKRYHEIKSTEEYKAKRRVYEKSWRKDNREAWNAKMKLASARYRAKKKALAADDKEVEQILNATPDLVNNALAAHVHKEILDTVELSDAPKPYPESRPTMGDEVKDLVPIPKKKNNYGDFE